MLEEELNYLEEVACKLAYATPNSMHPKILMDIIRHSKTANHFGMCLLKLIQEYKEATSNES